MFDCGLGRFNGHAGWEIYYPSDCSHPDRLGMGGADPPISAVALCRVITFQCAGATLACPSFASQDEHICHLLNYFSLWPKNKTQKIKRETTRTATFADCVFSVTSHLYSSKCLWSLEMAAKAFLISLTVKARVCMHTCVCGLQRW